MDPWLTQFSDLGAATEAACARAGERELPRRRDLVVGGSYPWRLVLTQQRQPRWAVYVVVTMREVSASR